MTKRTPLYDEHVAAGAKIVDFFGWDMPLHYGSQIEEHHFVRQHAGMFDVSHMGVVDVTGAQATEFLRYALANDVQKLKAAGFALYSCLLNESGGVVDDLIVYRTGDNEYRLVINASRRDADLAWLQQLANAFTVTLTPRPDLCIIAVQGPKALSIVQDQLHAELPSNLSDLKPFKAIILDDKLIGRTGYTGEDGVEIVLSADAATTLWQQLLKAGVNPCGLGARDTLRLEAGLNLYGADMNESTSPLVSNLAWTVALQDEARDFVGKAALLKEKQNGLSHKLVGLVMEERGVLRDHQTVSFANSDNGEVTSGSFSPTLGIAIALARIPADADEPAFVERRGNKVPVKIIKPPFVRHGEKVF